MALLYLSVRTLGILDESSGQLLYVSRAGCTLFVVFVRNSAFVRLSLVEKSEAVPPLLDHIFGVVPALVE